MVDDLAAKTSQLFVSLLNFLVQSLVFDLKLLVIDQMETFSQLLLLLKDLFLICKTVSKRDILETILMYFLIFGLVSLFPFLDNFRAELLVVSAMHGVHRDTALQLLELLLDLSALRLLFI